MLKKTNVTRLTLKLSEEHQQNRKFGPQYSKD